MTTFWSEYKEIEQELNIVKNIMSDSVVAGQKYLSLSLGDVINRQGKMLRPAFVILASKFGQCEKDKIYNLAAAVETLHTATLVHDDIVDDSKLRRGSESIQSKFGKDYAVYAGDYLLTQSTLMLSKYKYNEDNIKDLVKLISKICLGEMRQYSLRYSLQVDVRNYLKVISAKTAALFALSFAAGSKESGCDEVLSRNLSKIGYYIGMAFQIIDDILDFTGDTEKLGKGAQRDIVSGYYTLPLIYAMKNDKDNHILNILESTDYNEDDMIKIINLVNKYDGVNLARNLAKKYTNKIYGIIDMLPNNETKIIIKDVCAKLLNRQY